jgi:6-phosphogluconolactonase
VSKSFLFVGSCNRPTPYFASSNGRGISSYIFDDEIGRAELVSIQDDIDNPTFLTVDAKGETLYANAEMSGWAEGVVSAYKIDRATGALSLIGTELSLGNTPAQLSLDRTGRFLLVANYGLDERSRDGLNSSISILQIREDGSLASAVASRTHKGQVGPRADRQECSHAHAVVASPNNRFLVASDLGLDRLFVYRFDEERGALTDNGSCALPPGSGPRHFVFSQAGNMVYAANELNSTVASLSFDRESGALAILAIDEALPPAQAVHNHCSEIQRSPDGRWLYVANRGDDSLSIFRIDDAGRLSAIDRIATGGKTPRHFAFDPSGRFVAVANQDSDQVSVFTANDQGRFTLHHKLAEGTPMCICFCSL